MVEGLPEAPKDVLELRALEERWGAVDDWVFDATSAASHGRSLGFYDAMEVDSKGRLDEFRRIDRRYHDRLIEIEWTENAFKLAYLEARKLLNCDAIIAYTCAIKPILEAREREANVGRVPAWKRVIEQREAAAQEREERKMKRKVKKLRRDSVQNEGGDRDLPKADKSQAAVDEGPRGGTLPKD